MNDCQRFIESIQFILSQVEEERAAFFQLVSLVGYEHEIDSYTYRFHLDKEMDRLKRLIKDENEFAEMTMESCIWIKQQWPTTCSVRERAIELLSSNHVQEVLVRLEQWQTYCPRILEALRFNIVTQISRGDYCVESYNVQIDFLQEFLLVFGTEWKAYGTKSFPNSHFYEKNDPTRRLLTIKNIVEFNLKQRHLSSYAKASNLEFKEHRRKFSRAYAYTWELVSGASEYHLKVKL